MNLSPSTYQPSALPIGKYCFSRFNAYCLRHCKQKPLLFYCMSHRKIVPPSTLQFPKQFFFFEDLTLHCDLALEDSNPTFLHDTTGHDDACTIVPSLVAYSLMVRKISSRQKCATDRQIDRRTDRQPDSNAPLPHPPNYVTHPMHLFEQ